MVTASDSASITDAAHIGPALPEPPETQHGQCNDERGRRSSRPTASFA